MCGAYKMIYDRLHYNKKLELQKVKRIETNKEKDVFYCNVETPKTDYNVRIVVACDCHKGSNYGLKERKLCTHQVTAIKELLRTNDIEIKKKKGGFRGNDWEDVREEVLDRFKDVCQRCHNWFPRKSLDVHHIIPWRETEDNSKINLVPLCSKCHKKEDNYYTQFKKPSQTMLKIQEELR